jgi:hypothetical protein
MKSHNNTERKVVLTTKVMKCSCTNEYQDTKYGTGMRVHNLKSQQGKPVGWKCTCCGTVRT